MKYLRMNGAEIIELNEILRDEMKLKCLKSAIMLSKSFQIILEKYYEKL